MLNFLYFFLSLFISVTEVSDCFIVVVCLLILVVHQVLAKPIDNQGIRTSMDHALEETLRSPCREEKIPTQEDHNESNIKGILQVIKRQSAIAKSIARQDVVQYVSEASSFQYLFFFTAQIKFQIVIYV